MPELKFIFIHHKQMPWICFSYQNHKTQKMPVKIRSINPVCSLLLFISSCDHRRFCKRREYAIWQRIFSCSSDACRTDSRDQHCERSLFAPIHCHSQFCTAPATLHAKPKTPSRKTLVTANTSKLISCTPWLQRDHYFIILQGLPVWNARHPEIRNLLPHQICFILFF